MPHGAWISCLGYTSSGCCDHSVYGCHLDPRQKSRESYKVAFSAGGLQNGHLSSDGTEKRSQLNRFGDLLIEARLNSEDMPPRNRKNGQHAGVGRAVCPEAEIIDEGFVFRTFRDKFINFTG